jgi:hypothetical protein
MSGGKGLNVGLHTAIPRSNDDTAGSVINPDPAQSTFPDLLKAIAFTAGFHFAFIEQGGTSLYPALAPHGDQSGGFANPVEHRSERNHALPDLYSNFGEDLRSLVLAVLPVMDRCWYHRERIVLRFVMRSIRPAASHFGI